MSYGVGRRCGTDLALLWLRHQSVATALIQPLAWEHPYAVGVVLKDKKKKKRIKNASKYGLTIMFIFLSMQYLDKKEIQGILSR